MVAMVLNLEVDDYDDFKKRFDSDPGGRKGIATGHTISRNVENPNDSSSAPNTPPSKTQRKSANNFSTQAPLATSRSRLHPPSSRSQTRPPIRETSQPVSRAGDASPSLRWSGRAFADVP